MTTTSPSRESAEIYQFPARGRFAPESQNAKADIAQRYAKVVFGGSWYHEEAIQEDRARKN